MKVSLNWLKDYVEIPAEVDIKQLAYDITMRTVEIENVINLRDKFKGIVLGEILAIQPHENADSLWVTQVNVGQAKNLQIVCGGKNLFVGQKVAVSVPGAVVRWHGQGEPVKIETTKLRGVLSEGMICGANELDLDTVFPAGEEDILDLSDLNGEPGDELADVIGLDDYILEIDNKSMTHRPDLWGHYGLAREIAAIYQTKLKALPEFELPDDLAAYPVRIETDKCNAYSAYVIENLKLEPSPLKMRVRLWSVDTNPINNLVDITNYVMLTTGQPTHGFDQKHVPDGIVVRQARAGEELQLLDDNLVKLNSEDIVIASATSALALGGIMGGKKDSILPTTDSMILEIASFNPRSIRKTSKKLGIRTESSARYEKNIDTGRMDAAAKLALSLVKQLLPEAKLTAIGKAEQHKTEANRVKVSYAYLDSRIGRSINSAEIHNSLEPLGFKIIAEDAESFTVEAPLWRSTGDIELPADILEEIARMIGYENFVFIAPTVKLEKSINQLRPNLNMNIHNYLALRCGFQEIYTYPWVDDFYINACGLDTSDWVELEDAPAPTERKLRGSLVPGILEAVVKNIRYKNEFKIFEQAEVFRRGYYTPSDPDEVLPEQANYLAGAAVGNDIEKLFREVKGSIEFLPRYNNCKAISLVQVEQPAWADPKVWLNIISSEGEVIGDLALVSPKTARHSGLKNHYAVVFELDISKLEPLVSRTNGFEELRQYQTVQADLNILVDDEVKWADIEAIVAPLTLGVEFLEIYRDKNILGKQKSVLLRYWLGADDHTLSSAEIEQSSVEIIRQLNEKLGAVLKE